jgi:putative transposase
MPIPSKFFADFTEHGIYHVFNKTSNMEKLFLYDENRHFFLKKYNQFLYPYLDKYCWCLLPDHFHLLVRVKPVLMIQDHLQTIPFPELSLTEKRFLHLKITVSELIEQAFKRFFQSYALSFNKTYNRNGNLFYKPFKRLEINKESHFTQAIVYIHANPVKHKLVKDFTLYPWSSWQSILSDSPTRLLRNEILEWFGGKKLFIKAHKEMKDYYYESGISIED